MTFHQSKLAEMHFERQQSDSVSPLQVLVSLLAGCRSGLPLQQRSSGTRCTYVRLTVLRNETTSPTRAGSSCGAGDGNRNPRKLASKCLTVLVVEFHPSTVSRIFPFEPILPARLSPSHTKCLPGDENTTTSPTRRVSCWTLLAPLEKKVQLVNITHRIPPNTSGRMRLEIRQVRCCKVASECLRTTE